MNSLLMRKIDRWVGVPLCWLCTLALRLWSWLGQGQPPQGAPRRIMVIELAEIGGLVVAYPALAHLRRRFSQAELYFLTFAGGQGILDLLGVIDREHQVIIRPDGLATFLGDTLAAIRRMRQLGIDATINLEALAEQPDAEPRAKVSLEELSLELPPR